MRCSVLALTLAMLRGASAQDVYKLKWIGDYQTGEAWDTDSAEHLAYDSSTQRAFVASAEASTVQVVDISDPTAMTQVGALSVSADLKFHCMEVDCIYESIDFGAGQCSYAPMAKIIYHDANFSLPSWYSGPSALDPTMTSPEDCRVHCQNTPGCAFWSYEYELQDWGGRVHECYAKYEYTASQAGGSGFTVDECNVDSLRVWEAGPLRDQHAEDEHWVGAAGPVTCDKVRTESVQSVGMAYVPGYDNPIVAAAAPHEYSFADGWLAFYDAVTLEFLSCQPAGNKPEGLTFKDNMVGCVNEGSMTIDHANDMKDNAGSITMCEGSMGIMNHNFPTFDCTTYEPSAATFVGGEATSFDQTTKSFVGGQWSDNSQEWRWKDVRLYGPSATDIHMDLEPEGGAFTDDGKYFLAVMQDNNAYMMFDVAAQKYLFMSGFGYKEQTMDASDKDDYINIKSRWGSQNIKVQAMYQPDVVSSITINGEYFFLTANEGDTRDGEDMIGVSEIDFMGDTVEFEGEESRMGDLPCTCSDCCEKEELGRLLTTVYQPSNFAINAGGQNLIDSWTLAYGLNSTFDCMYKNADYGGGSVCGYAPMAKILHSDPTNAVCPGWFSGPCNYNSQLGSGPGTGAKLCKQLCAADTSCDYWSFEFEEGIYECFLKTAFTDISCDEYRWWNGKYDDPNWYGLSGPATCPLANAVYTNVAGSHEHGTPGGSISVGGRSVTIWKWDGTSDKLDMVWDSGSDMEMATKNVANDLCKDCDSPGADCSKCPFNADSVGADMGFEDRSDAKGPEPECVTTGTLSDGTILSFVGLERSGGIITHDITDPYNPIMQDFLNVRNWQQCDSDLADSETAEDNDDSDYFVKTALNDGPEGLVFVPADVSSIGQSILLAVAPMAGRLTAYVVEKGDRRDDDGSCECTSTCGYIPVADGGTGKNIVTACDVASGSKKSDFNCPEDDNNLVLYGGIGGGVAVLLSLGCAWYFWNSKRKTIMMYNELTAEKLAAEASEKQAKV